MKIKTSELTNLALDWAVASARGFLEPEEYFGETRIRVVVMSDEHSTSVVFNPKHYGHYGPEDFNPSANWDLAGPIIEEERLSVTPRDGLWDALVHDRLFQEDGSDFFMQGPTPLVAAMRCYVASKLGAEVDVPDELSKNV